MSALSKLHADEAVVHDLLMRDRASVESFVRANAGWMHRVARRYLHDEGLAEDCVQESFARMFAALDCFEHRSRLKSWLHRIVVNTALMKLRSIRRHREEPLDSAVLMLDCQSARIAGHWAEATTPADNLDRAEASAIVVRGINSLPENYRVVLQLLDIDGLDTSSVATALNLSQSNVKVRLHRARRALKCLIEPALV